MKTLLMIVLLSSTIVHAEEPTYVVGSGQIDPRAQVYDMRTGGQKHIMDCPAGNKSTESYRKDNVRKFGKESYSGLSVNVCQN